MKLSGLQKAFIFIMDDAMTIRPAARAWARKGILMNTLSEPGRVYAYRQLDSQRNADRIVVGTADIFPQEWRPLVVGSRINIRRGVK